MFEKKRAQAAKRQSEEGTAKTKNKTQPRRRVRHSLKKEIGTATGDSKQSCWEGEDEEEEVEEE